jgi:integrase
MSLRLEEAFGLRREESIKLRPCWHDRGDVLHLKASWTKGARERDVPVTNAMQRQALDEAKALAQGGSLIPTEMNYRDQQNRFKPQTARAGIHGVHGLRHAYAQRRYFELTGWKAPAADGPLAKDLTAGQKSTDRTARSSSRASWATNESK